MTVRSRKKRILGRLALLLAITLLLCVPLSACSNNPDNNSGGEYNGPGEWDGTRETTPDTLPEDLYYDGATVSVLYRAHLKEYEAEGEAGSDIVYQAVYERNAMVENRLGIKFDWCPTEGSAPSAVSTEMVNVLSALIDDYDYILTTNNTILSSGMNAYLWDFSYAPYIDLSQPWWWTECIEATSFDGKHFNYLTGEMNLFNFMTMSAFYFNVPMLKTYLDLTSEDMYAKVDEGKWTIDELHRLVSKCYYDKNGDNIANVGDVYGMPIAGNETVNQLALSTKLNLYERVKPLGTIKFTMNNDRTVQVCEKLTRLMHDNSGIYNQKPINGSSGFDTFVIEDFASGKYVFMAQRFTAACTQSMRQLDDDYGIIPYPTLEEGDEYVTYIQPASTCVSVPVAVNQDRFERACAVLEALAAEAYRSVTEKFYEYALKSKYVRDDYGSPRMIDIIYNTSTKYFLWEYNTVADNIMGIYANAIINKQSVATLYAQSGQAAEKTVNDFIVKCISAYR